MKVKQEKELENSREIWGLQWQLERTCRIPEEMRVGSKQRSQPLSAISMS